MTKASIGDLPKSMQEEIRAVEVTEAHKHIKELLKDPLYQEVIWNEFFAVLEKKKKRMEKKYPYKVYRTFSLLVWFINTEP